MERSGASCCRLFLAGLLITDGGKLNSNCTVWRETEQKQWNKVTGSSMGSYTGPTLASLELCSIKCVEAEQAHAAGIYSPIARKGVKPYVRLYTCGVRRERNVQIERERYSAKRQSVIICKAV